MAAMHSLMIGLTATAVLAGAAQAQDTTGPNAAVNGKGNAASSVNASGTATIVAPSALTKGANSFTEAQVRSRLEGAGLTGVSALHKDESGIWRGRGLRDGRSVDLGFDYKGNIAVQ